MKIKYKIKSKKEQSFKVGDRVKVIKNILEGGIGNNTGLKEGDKFTIGEITTTNRPNIIGHWLIPIDYGGGISEKLCQKI